MSQLFVELYLDEDVDVLVANLIRARGFAVLTTRDAGQLGRDDAAQLGYAVSYQKAFVTHNRADFEALAQRYFATGQAHAGIIIAVRHDPYELVRRLLVILNQVTADEMHNQLRYI
ncbi:MAG: DUF5615 family PIN-like protein [Kouleothrix sp.]|nr:DUF5615 family PIN-like protein [Kouleothrix sp.]MBK9944974.1 DUF5615 family PIN-like protein [Kouleothrix sp.]